MANGDAYFCVAVGSRALESNKGQLNTALGKGAMQDNTSGTQNTACGWSALVHNLTGFNNTAMGLNSLANNTNGSNNIALGDGAGINLTSGNDNIDIGSAGLASESGVTRIGTAGTQTATFIAGIREAPLAYGVAVAVGITADGQLGVRASSPRFKEAIKPMDKKSEAILALQPVTFRYKKDLDPSATPQFGLVAEEVAKVDPDLVALDETGKPYTVRYEEVNAMLLNEFLKEHRKVEALESSVARQQADSSASAAQHQRAIETLTAALQVQAAQIKQVNDRLDVARAAPRVVSSED